MGVKQLNKVEGNFVNKIYETRKFNYTCTTLVTGYVMAGIQVEFISIAALINPG